MIQPGFTGAGLDRADHLRLDAERLADLMMNGDARLLRLDAVDPVLDEGGRLLWDRLDGGADILFLGLEEGRPLFAPLVRMEQLGQRAWGVFRLLALMSPRDAAIWGAARSLNEWHNRHGFCPACGHATAPFRAGWGRKCGQCAAEHFPRVDPVVIMLAEHDGRVLLGRSPHYPPGRYSALAGFVEPGESIEEAVAREIKEEAGVAVTDVRYVASQPWPFPGSLMIACIGRAESAVLTLDRNELEEAFWCDRAGVRAALAGDAQAPFQAPPPFAIANTLLTRWSEGE
ncbi:MAG TPA: NAD(+) diphosphatase [Allosphingosinicella sp.]|nr:NAD(+) diphosphatase [Allosphingosinicella sp.]